MELQLAGVTDIQAGNRFLPAYIKRHNQRFATPAEEPGLAYRPLDPDLDLDHILSFRYMRVVARDNTVRLDGTVIQIPPGARRRSYFAAHVSVHEFLDGSLGVWYQGQWLVRGKAAKLDVRVRARKNRKERPERKPLPLPLEKPERTPVQLEPHPWRAWRPGYLSRDRRIESLSS